MALEAQALILDRRQGDPHVKVGIFITSKNYYEPSPQKTADDLADKCNNTLGETHVFGPMRLAGKTYKSIPTKICAICF